MLRLLCCWSQFLTAAHGYTPQQHYTLQLDSTLAFVSDHTSPSPPPTLHTDAAWGPKTGMIALFISRHLHPKATHCVLTPPLKYICPAGPDACARLLATAVQHCPSCVSDLVRLPSMQQIPQLSVLTVLNTGRHCEWSHFPFTEPLLRLLQAQDMTAAQLFELLRGHATSVHRRFVAQLLT
jgi:hypothetical protein